VGHPFWRRPHEALMEWFSGQPAPRKTRIL
jgi:hypothetical protein